MRRALCHLVLFATLTPGAIFAEDFAFGGFLKHQSINSIERSGSQGERLRGTSHYDGVTSTRLFTEKRWEGWEASLHVYGNVIDGAVSSTNLPSFRTDSRRLLTLADTFDQNDDFSVQAGIDRASLGFVTETSSVRVGRQALSWGNGLVFHALDVINPFSPLTIDKDYKPGEDMVTAHYMTSPESDLHLAVVGRRDESTGSATAEEASFALRGHHRFEESNFDLDLFAASHYGEPFLGVGMSTEAFDAVFRLDASFVPETRSDATSRVAANVERSWTIGGRNVSASLEYFFNGFGTTGSSPLPLSQELTERLNRGELFTTRRNYGAATVRVEVHPLVNLFALQIVQLDDGSGVTQFREVIDLSDSTRLSLGVDLPSGHRGTEFGGLALPDGTTAAPARQVYAKLDYYF